MVDTAVTAIALPMAEAEGGMMAEAADADEVPSTDDAAEMQSRAAEEPPPAETEAEADGGSTGEEPEHEHQPTATAGVGSVPAEAVDIRTERSSDVNDFAPLANTEGTQQQAASEEVSEQLNVEGKSITTSGSEATAAAAAAAPVELMDPMVDHELKPSSLSSQSEESIRTYLDNTVVPVLRDGLRMLVKERPEDPCNYLVDYIKAHHP